VFANWTVLSGSPAIADANAANTTVTLSAPATIQANFTSVANHAPVGRGGEPAYCISTRGLFERSLTLRVRDDIRKGSEAVKESDRRVRVRVRVRVLRTLARTRTRKSPHSVIFFTLSDPLQRRAFPPRLCFLGAEVSVPRFIRGLFPPEADKCGQSMNSHERAQRSLAAATKERQGIATKEHTKHKEKVLENLCGKTRSSGIVAQESMQENKGYRR